MPKKGSRRKKTRTHVKPTEASADPTASKVPKSFVVKSGTVGGSVAALVRDVRKVLEPNTGSRIRERKANRLRDFVAMSGPLGVTHLLVFSQPPSSTAFLTPSTPAPAPVLSKKKGKNPQSAKEEAEERAEKSLLEGTTTLNLRLIRLPRGPTLGFKVLRYSLASDILRMARRPRSVGREFAESPLLILSGFGGEDKQLKLMTTVFQNLFPPIHVQTMALASARRVVLLSYNSETHTIDFRHFLISVRPVGVSRPIRKIVAGSTANKALPLGSRKRERSMSVGSSDDEGAYGGTGVGARGKGVLDLGRAEDISDYVLRHEGMGFVTSDSEMSDQSDGGGSQSGHSSGSEEDERRGKVRLAGDYVGRGNRGNGVKGEKRAVRLVELGPRMELGLIKVEEGVGEGEVMFHEMVHKSVSEAAKLSKVHSARRKLVAERRAAQAANVEAKKAAKKLAAGGDAEDDDDEDKEGADEEEDDDKIDSDNSFDYDEEHGLAVDDDEEEVSEAELGDDESGEDQEDDEEEEEEEEEFSDGSDMSPIAYHSSRSNSPEEEDEATPAFLPKKKQTNRPSGNGPMSFKHKSFVKQERAPAKAAAGIHYVKVEKKKKEEEDFDADERGGGGRGGRGGRGGDRGRGGRGGSRGSDRGGRGGFAKRGESTRGGRGGSSRGGSSRGGSSRGGRGRN